MATSKGRRAELKKLRAAEQKWSFYRSLCQFRLGYFSFLVMMVIVMFSFTFLMEIFFAIFLPSARNDPQFTERAILLLLILPFALILLSYLFEESSRLLLDTLDKSEGSLRNFRLSVAVVIHYLRHRDAMPEDRLHRQIRHNLEPTSVEDAGLLTQCGVRLMRLLAVFGWSEDPFSDENKEVEDAERDEIEKKFQEDQQEPSAIDTLESHDAKTRWKTAIFAAKSTAAFRRTRFDGPPVDFSTLVVVDFLCPVLFEIVTILAFISTLMDTWSPLDAFVSYVRAGFYIVMFYLVVWMICHFWSSRHSKMREFVSNYRRRHRNMERALEEVEEEKKSQDLWLIDVGFRAYEFFLTLFYSTVRLCCALRPRLPFSIMRSAESQPLLPMKTEESSEQSHVESSADELVETREGKYRLRELKDRFVAWNPWTKMNYNQRLVVLFPLVLTGALLSFATFFVGWTVMGICMILLAYTIQRRFPQIFGAAFRSFITCFVVLSFVFFSSTWAIGTFVHGGDFKVYPPALSQLETTSMYASSHSTWGSVAQYPVCSLNMSSLDIVDFALIADAVYGYDKDVQFQSLSERFNGTDLSDWQFVARNNESVSHRVWVELFFPSINMTVVAVRGTASATDALEDLHYWFGVSIMQAVDIFFPFLKQLPSTFVVNMLSMRMFDGIMPPPVYSELLNHVAELREKHGKNLVLTGHSLGGAMAAVVGAKTKTPAVSFSGPGLLYTRGRFDIKESDIRDYVLTIKPRLDIVPRVDELGGMVQEIECRRHSPLACHSTSTHLCELYASCGDRRGRDWSKASQCVSYLA